MSGKPIDAEDIAVLLRLQAALPNVGLNGWFEGVQALDRVIEYLTAAQQQQGQAVACVCCEDKPAPGNNPCGWCGRTAPPSTPVGVEAVRGAWLAAITLANNICVQESDRENDRDGDTAWIDGTAKCAKRIREYAHPTDAELLEMLDEAGANAAKAALAQQPAADPFEREYRAARAAGMGFEDAWHAAIKTEQQPAAGAVDDIAVELEHFADCPARVLVLAGKLRALAAQHQEPKS